MRSDPRLVGLACVLLVVVPTSLFAGAQEPEDPRAPSRDAPGEATRLEEWTGTSVLRFRGACVAQIARCVSDVEREDGSFFLAAPSGGGSLVVSWRPVNESLRVLKVSLEGVDATGESPLRLDFSGLEAGEHAVRIEPVHPLVGAYDQSADWVASFAVSLPAATIDTRGKSVFAAAAGCVLGTCDPATRVDSDSFLAPWTARGRLEADWDATEGSMRIGIRGADIAAEGRPPLVLDVYALAPGEYEVDVTPIPVAQALGTVEVSWRATLSPG